MPKPQADLPPAARKLVVVFQERNIYDPQRRGATVFTHDTVTALTAHYDVVVVSGSSSGEGADFKDDSGIRFLQLGTKSLDDVYEDVQNYVESGALAEALGGRPIHFGLEEANWNPFQTPSWDVDFPISTVIYHVQPHWIRADGTTALDSYAEANAHVLDISQFTKGVLAQHGVHNVKTLPVALPSGKDVVIGQSGSHPVVVWAGAYSKEKRPELAIEAVALAAREVPGLQLRLLGRLPDPSVQDHPYADIQQRYAHLVEAGTIEFIDSPSDKEMVEHFAHARVLINSSEAACEGFGLVIAEAAFQGCTPIAVPGGGAAEATRLCRGKVASSDAPEALAQELIALVPRLVDMREAGQSPNLASPTRAWSQVALELASSSERNHQLEGMAQMMHAATHSLTGSSAPELSLGR